MECKRIKTNLVIENSLFLAALSLLNKHLMINSFQKTAVKFDVILTLLLRVSLKTQNFQ